MSNPVFLVLGLSNGGLFLSRQLHKEWPEATIYAIGEPKDIGKYSCTVETFIEAFTEEEVLESIKRVFELTNGDKVKAYMCSNPMLELLAIHHPEWFELMQFENDYGLYRRIVDKVAVDNWCRSLGITRPKEYDLSDSMLSEICFPIVVKPLEKANAKGASKCAYLSDRDSLLSYLKKMDGLGIHRNDLVCQQCVEGDNRWEYGYGGFFKEGIPLVDICFYQFIQVPQGLCCYSREVTDEALKTQIKDLVAPFLEDSKYNGFIEFDIKQDSKDKTLYLLDINPRPWRSVDILKAKLGSSTVFNPKVSDRKAVWRYPYRELFRRKNRKNVSYKICKALTRGYKTTTQIALHDKNDPRPCRMQRKADFHDFVNKLKR